jgi:hypothetical protein
MSGHRRNGGPDDADVSLAARLGSGASPAGAPPPSSRRERRAQKRASAKRRRLLALGIVAILVVVAAAVLLVPVLRGDDTTPNAPSPAARTQQTMVMMLAGEESVAFSSALMGADASANEGTVVLVPTSLLVEGPTPEPIRFGTTVRLPDPNAPALALEDTLSVVVDATWRLSPAGLASLVDAVGGVNVSVDEDLILTRADGTEEIVVPGGTTSLNGAQAAAYSVVLPQGQQEQARLAHFNEVLFALIPKLPSDQGQLSKLIKGLGRESAVTTGVAWLSQFLLDQQAAMAAGNVPAQTLPVAPIDVGSPRPLFTVDEQPAETLMAAEFADSRPAGGANQLTVYLQNGVGTPGLVESAAEQLRKAGYDYVNGGNSNRFGYTKTVVIVPDASEAALANGRAVAKVLRVPDSAITVASQGQTVADVIVIIGADYKP